jgi:hypothetical protein
MTPRKQAKAPPSLARSESIVRVAASGFGVLRRARHLCAPRLERRLKLYSPAHFVPILNGEAWSARRRETAPSHHVPACYILLADVGAAMPSCLACMTTTCHHHQ